MMMMMLLLLMIYSQKAPTSRNKRLSHLCQVIDGDVEERVDNPDSTVYLIFMEAHKNEKKFNETHETKKDEIPGVGGNLSLALLF